MFERTLNPEVWAAVPFHFWSVTFFVFGSMVGSFLNVCIYRMPRDLSVVSPPSHCPHCKYSIPWYLNMPLITWLYLRGKCAHCRAPISPRYFGVELLTGIAFLLCWLVFGAQSAPTALIYGFVLAAFITAAFIDLEHYIIPDEITLGGIVAGFLCSAAFPGLHHAKSPAASMRESFFGIVVGAGVVYAVVRLGKLIFGRKKIPLPPGTRVIFTETAVILPDETIEYGELFYRNSDYIQAQAAQVEMVDRCAWNVRVRLTPKRLSVGEDLFDPDTVQHLEIITDEIILPREAMGFGDVKFMAAIGAFLGWPATVFSLLFSSVIGVVVTGLLILVRRQEWTTRIPYGPYIAAAAVVWMFGGGAAIWNFLQGR